MRRLLTCIAALLLTAPALAEDGPSSYELQQNYLEVIDDEISRAQDALDAFREAPHDVVVMQVDGLIVHVNMRELRASDEFAGAAFVVQTFLASSPTAWQMGADRFGNKVEIVLRQSGLPPELSQIIGMTAGLAAGSAPVTENAISTDEVMDTMTTWLNQEIRARGMREDAIEAEIALLWQIRDEIETALADQTIDVAELCSTFVFSDLEADIARPDALALVGVRIPLFLIGGDYYSFANAHLNANVARVSARYSFEGDRWARTNCDGTISIGDLEMILRNDPPNPQSGVSFDGRVATRYDLERSTLYVFSD